MRTVSKSPVGPDGEQTAETLQASAPQTPETASAPAAVLTPSEAARLIEPSDEQIRLRAYFISEHRRSFAFPGDEDSDWREAKQQLLSESGELSGPPAITTEESREISVPTEEIAPPAIVTSAETEVGVVEEGQPVSHEAHRTAEPDSELPPPPTEQVSESPVGPDGEQTAETLRPPIPQTPEIAPALAAALVPPEAARVTEPLDEQIRLRAYFISEHRCRFALPGDADSDWREAKQQLLSKSGELSGPSMITKEEPREIPARTEEIAPPAVGTSAETEVGLVEEGQVVSDDAYRKAEPDSELTPPTEPVSESPVGSAVEQTAETLRPSAPQTPETASAPAAVHTPPEAGRLTEPSDEEIRAHVISEHRRRFALPGDTDSDWREAKQQLLSESGELSGPSTLSTITTKEPREIPARTEEIAPPAVGTSAETEVGLVEEGQVVSDDAYRKAEPDSELTPPTEQVSESPVGPDGEQTAETLRPTIPQTPEIAPALAAIPIPPEVARVETTQMPPAPVAEPVATAEAKSQPSGTMQTSVQLTFSFKIAAMRLTPTFKIAVLQVRPISTIVTMHLAPFRQAQLEVSFKIAKIQPVGETFGTIRVTPSRQRMPMTSSPSFVATGLQLVPNGEAAPIQLMPSPQDQAVVSMTVPCRITAIEFSPLLEIASVVLNSSSKQVLVHLAGAVPSPAGGQQVFEITDLQLNEGGTAGMMQLRQSAERKWNGRGASPFSMIRRFEDSPAGMSGPEHQTDLQAARSSRLR